MAAYEARLWRDVVADRADRRAGPRGDRQGLPRAGRARDRQCRLGAARRRRRAVRAAARGRGSRHGRDVGRDALRAQRRGGLVVRCARSGRWSGPSARRRASSWSAATRRPPAGAGRQGRDHRHRHGRGAGRLDRAGGGLRGTDPRRRRAAEQAARGHGDGQGRGRDPGRQRGHRGPRGEAVLLAEEPAPFARAVLALLADPGRRRGAGRRRRGRSSRPSGPGRARSWSWRRRFSPPDPGCGIRPQASFCCTAQFDPLQPAVATPSYCASQQNPEMPPWPSPPFPSSSFPS